MGLKEGKSQLPLRECMAAGRQLPNSSSVIFAELMDAWMGLYDAVQVFHAEKLWLEGDSSSTITWLSPLSNCRLARDPLIMDIVRWMTAADASTILHIKQEANKVAN